MKPFKTGKPVAIWLLRISLLPLLYHLYYTPVSTMNFGNIAFFLGVIMFLCGLFIVLGGLFARPWMTIISGFLLFGLSIYKVIVSFNGILDMNISMHLITISLGLFFFTNGNEN